MTKGRILIVEDNPCNQVLISKFLSKLEVSFDLAENGKEALEYLDVIKYELVLMDIMMPIMDGIECTKLIRAHSNRSIASIPIIAISANPDKEAEALDAGMDSFLGKPILLPTLEATIRQRLGMEIKG
jgi:CheY-like chemotaxis protein